MGEKIAGLDVLGEEYFADPHAYHARLREQAAASPIVLPRGTKAWLVTRYEEARSALADPRFSKHWERFPEVMELNAGACRIRLAGAEEWTEYAAGESFSVPGDSSFDIEVTETLGYVCHYG